MDRVEEFPVWRDMFQVLLDLQPPANAIRLLTGRDRARSNAVAPAKFLRELDSSIRGLALQNDMPASSLPRPVEAFDVRGYINWKPAAAEGIALILTYGEPGAEVPQLIREAVAKNCVRYDGIEVHARDHHRGTVMEISYGQARFRTPRASKVPGHVTVQGWGTFTVHAPESLLVGPHRTLRRPTTNWLNWASVLDHPQSAGNKQILRRALELSVAMHVDVGLYILEEWHHQRDSWLLSKLVDRRGREFNLYRTGVLLSPSKMASRVLPGSKDPNWRQRLFRALQAMAVLGLVEYHGRATRFIEAVVDLRDLKLDPLPHSRLPDALVAADLLRAGVPKQDAFVVVLGEELFPKMPPHKVDERTGRPCWEEAAVDAIERQDTSREAFEERKRLRAMGKFMLHPSVVARANHLNLSAAARRALYCILGELRHRQNYADKTLATTHFACFGARTGYRVGTWADRLISKTVSARSRRQALVKVLEELHNKIGLELRMPPRDHQTDDVLLLLSKSTRRTRRARTALAGDNRLLTCYLPKDYLQQARASASARQDDSLGDRSLDLWQKPWSPDDLHLRRKARGWTQSELAAHLGLSRATVAQWEAGTRAVTKKWESRLDELFGVGAQSGSD